MSNNFLNALARRAVGVALLAGLAVPAFVSAAQVRGETPAVRANAVGQRTAPAANFCTLLLNRPSAERAVAQLQQRTQNLAQRRTKLTSAVQTVRRARDAKLDALRDKQTAWRAEASTRLMSRAKNDAQKAAIRTFMEEIAAALAARHEAVDAANAAFRAGMDEARADRKTALDAAVSAFTGAVTAAETAAKTACAVEDADAAQIRKTMADAVAAARERMRAAVQVAEKVGADAADLAKTRNAALRKAMETFTAATEQARQKLKAAIAAAPAPEDEASE